MKRFIVLGASLLALMASLLVGCAGGELTEAEMEQVLTDVLTANAEVDTCKFDLNMQATIEMSGGPEPGGASMLGSGTGVVDSAAREMHMIMNTIIDTPDDGEVELSAEYYVVDGWMHIKMNLPDQGEQWMKMQMPEEMWEAQSQIEQQLELLETADEANYLGTEDVDGTPCYVVEIVASAEALGKLMSQYQLPEMEGVDLGEFDLTDMMKEMSVKQWVAKDSYLFMKTENHILLEILPGNVGASEEEFGKITEDITSEMKFYDYGEAVSIELPEEALQAS